MGKAITSAAKLYQIADRQPQVKGPDAGEEPRNGANSKIDGRIELKNVTFAYPMRPDVKVFENFSLKANSGDTVALVGPSGCGKSTIVSLVERFYDPLEGEILLDDVSLHNYDLKYL